MLSKILVLPVIACVFTFGARAQESYTPLATMEGRSFTVTDLPANVGNAWSKLPETIKAAKTELLELQVKDLLLSQEAAKRSMDKDALIEAEVEKKVPDPDEASIKAVYEENKRSLGDTPLAEVRTEIIEYLRIEPEKAALDAFVGKLREAGRVEYLKDVNAEGLSLNDVLVQVNSEPITYAAYKLRNGLAVYEYEANVFDEVEASLTMIVDAAIYQAEAIERGIPVNRLIESEITSKMSDFSADEQERLEAALKKRLYDKYRVKYFISEPEPLTQDVSADDDPFQGKESAPVTIVVFGDYECPACAGIHPLIKRLGAQYRESVRIVYRDFPLEKVHKNAFNAALAANAALKQGKFFEYSDLLYENQENLDKESLKKYALELGLNLEKFAADMESQVFAAEVRKDQSDGASYGVTGTPSIFVNGYKVRTLSLPALEKAIGRALAGEF